MFQPSTSFLVGCAMVACLVSERGALLRGFSAGSYSCTVAAIVWRHLLGRDSRLHSAGDYALESVKIIQVATDTSCPWSSVGESGVRAALNAEGIGVLAVHDDRRIFGVNGHNYSHLVKILDGAGPSLHSAFARSNDLYYQWAGFDPRSAEYLQHIALALACQEPRELVRVTDRPQIPRMISDASWLAAAAGESTLLMELKADPNDADAWVLRSLHGLMDLPAYRATALGRAAAKYVHDRLMPVAQTLDFMWYQALASVSALRTFRDPPAQWRSFSRRDAIPAWGRLYNRLHPGVDIYSVHFVKKMPWCQYFNGQGSRTDCQLPDGSEVSLAVMLPV